MGSNSCSFFKRDIIALFEIYILHFYRFPRAGSNNSISNFKMIELAIRQNEILVPRILELRQPIMQLLPWAEYIVRAGWTPESQQ